MNSLNVSPAHTQRDIESRPQREQDIDRAGIAFQSAKGRVGDIDRDQLEIGGRKLDLEVIIKRLEPILTTERIAKVQAVARARSFRFVSVLENIYDRGNVSAVMRSADAFGFPRIHIVDQPGADIRSFTVTLSQAAGTRRGQGKGSFVSSVTSLVDQFYAEVVQPIKVWSLRRLMES